MSHLATIVAFSLRRRRGLLATMFVAVTAFQIFMILAARNLEDAGGFSQISNLLPAFMKQWSNMAVASFSGFVLFGYLHPLVQLFLIAVAISIGTEPAADVETRFVDLLMARPVRRSLPIVRTQVVLAVVTIGAVASMVGATWVGLRLFAPPTARPPDMTLVVSMAANLALLVMAWGGVALAIAAGARRRTTAAATVGLLAFAGFVLDYVGRFWDAIGPVARFSPFHYFDPFAMMGGQPLRLAHLAVLGAIVVASAIVAHVVYARRDL